MLLRHESYVDADDENTENNHEVQHGKSSFLSFLVVFFRLSSLGRLNVRHTKCEIQMPKVQYHDENGRARSIIQRGGILQHHHKGSVHTPVNNAGMSRNAVHCRPEGHQSLGVSECT